MRIDKVEIDGFGKLHNVSLDFSPGVNLILGDNESGKSTLCEFLLAMFYTLPNDKKTADAYENGRKKYRPWQGSAFGGRVYFTDDDGTRYLLEKSFGKTKNSDRAKLLYADTWEPAGEAADAGERFFGLGREGFIKTLYVKSLDANSSVGSGEILSRLSNMETGADEDISYDKIKAAMEKAHGQIITRTGRGGRLPALLEQKRELEAEKLLLARKRELLKNAELEAAELAKKEAELKHTIQRLEEMSLVAKEHEAYGSAKQAEHSRSVLQARYQGECKRLEELKASHKALLDRANTAVAPSELAAGKELEKQLIIAQSKAEEWEESQKRAREEAERQLKKRGRMRKIAFMLIALGALFGVACSFASVPIAACGLAAFVAAGAVMAALSKGKTADVEAQSGESPREAAQKLEDALKALCASYQTETLSELEDLARKSAQAQENLAKAAEAVRVLEEETEQMLKEILKLRMPEQQAFSEEAMAYSGPSFDELQKSVRQKQEEQRSLTEKVHKLRLELAKETAGERSLSQVESELGAIAEEAEALKQQDAAFCLAEEWLGRAHREIKENFAPLLNRKTAEIFAFLTDGKYGEVRVGEGFSLHYRNENGAITDSGQLSAGTYDLLYIAQRFGALLTLFPKTVPPLIFDDAFQQLDDGRYQKAMAFINREERLGQVLSFTCHRETVHLLKEAYINFIDLNEKGASEHGLQD